MELTITKKYFIIDPPPSGGGGGSGDGNSGCTKAQDIANAKFLQGLVNNGFIPSSINPILEVILEEEKKESQSQGKAEATIDGAPAQEETIWDKVKSLAGLSDKAKKNRW